MGGVFHEEGCRKCLPGGFLAWGIRLRLLAVGLVVCADLAVQVKGLEREPKRIATLEGMRGKDVFHATGMVPFPG